MTSSRRIPASVAASSFYTIPIFAILIGWMVLREVPSALSIAGGVLAFAGVTLVKGDLRAIARARALSQATMRNIRQNLFGAFAYNILAIPVAAGVFYPAFDLLLNPMIAGAAMGIPAVLGNGAAAKEIANAVSKFVADPKRLLDALEGVSTNAYSSSRFDAQIRRGPRAPWLDAGLLFRPRSTRKRRPEMAKSRTEPKDKQAAPPSPPTSRRWSASFCTAATTA